MKRTLFFVFCVLHSLSANCQQYFLFIGTYTTSGSKGIYVYSFDASTGKATWVSNTEGVVNPSYLAVAPDGQQVYACTETATANAGSISAFRFDKGNGKLTFLNKQPSGGDNPVYVSIHKNGRWVVAANYSGGSVSAFPVDDKGGLKPYSQSILHTGKSVNKLRQDRPHIHSAVFSPGCDYLFVPDLGLDKIMVYKFDPGIEKPLQAASQPFVATDPGTGPRHFVFHPNKKHAYLVEEMGGAVDVFEYRKGHLEKVQRITTHSDTATGEFGSADIHLSPDGKFLYASNRGNENNIAIFSVAKNGQLRLTGFQPAMGVRPRNFTIDPSGNYLLVANQATNNIVIFKRDNASGMLQYTGNQINIPEPVCLQMISR